MACSRRWVSINHMKRDETWLTLDAAVRAGGFYVVTIADLRQGLLVLYGKSTPAMLFAFTTKH